MVKEQQVFLDGTSEKYIFANNQTITLITKKLNKNYVCDISWNFGELFCEPQMPNEINNQYKTYNQARLKETLQLYKTLRKQKNKCNDKKLLITATMMIIHKIKQEIEFQQNLF